MTDHKANETQRKKNKRYQKLTPTYCNTIWFHYNTSSEKADLWRQSLYYCLSGDGEWGFAVNNVKCVYIRPVLMIL